MSSKPLLLSGTPSRATDEVAPGAPDSLKFGHGNLSLFVSEVGKPLDFS